MFLPLAMSRPHQPQAKPTFQTELLQDANSAAASGLKQQLVRFTKRLSAKPVELKRHSVDGAQCSPGEVTAANVSAAAATHKRLTLDPELITLTDEGAAFPLKMLGTYSASYSFAPEGVEDAECQPVSFAVARIFYFLLAWPLLIFALCVPLGGVYNQRGQEMTCLLKGRLLPAEPTHLRLNRQESAGPDELLRLEVLVPISGESISPTSRKRTGSPRSLLPGQVSLVCSSCVEMGLICPALVFISTRDKFPPVPVQTPLKLNRMPLFPFKGYTVHLL